MAAPGIHIRDLVRAFGGTGYEIVGVEEKDRRTMGDEEPKELAKRIPLPPNAYSKLRLMKADFLALKRKMIEYVSACQDALQIPPTYGFNFQSNAFELLESENDRRKPDEHPDGPDVGAAGGGGNSGDGDS